jgi:hypothetical protein
MSSQDAYITFAAPIRVLLDDAHVHASPKTFSTGSSGWYYSGKVQLLCGEEYLTCQVSLCLTVVGSKKWQEGQQGPQEARERHENPGQAIYLPDGPSGPQEALTGLPAASETPKGAKVSRKRQK